MKKLLAIALLLMSAAAWAQTCRVVTPGGSGNNSGTDWSNACAAWTGACNPNSLIRGATYFVGKGAYTGQSWGAPTSGSQVITIKAPTAAVHCTDTGFVSATHVGQANFSGRNTYPTNFWTIDGSYGTPFSKGSYGIKQTWVPGTADGENACRSGGCSNITFLTIEQQGSGDCGSTGTNSDYGFFTASGNYSNITMDGVYGWQQNGIYHVNTTTNMTLQHSISQDNYSGGACHGENVAFDNSANILIRWNKFVNCAGTACIADPSGVSDTTSNIEIYGNIFYNDKGAGVACENKGGTGPCLDNGIATVLGGGNWVGSKIYNNTIANWTDNKNNPSSFALFKDESGGTHSNVDIRNNLFYNNLQAKNNEGTTCGFNSFYQTPLTTTACTGDVTGLSTNPFINPAGQGAAANFNLVADTAAWDPLPAPYNVDMNGITRISSRGALQFGSATSPIVTLTPSTTLDFGGQQIGSPSATKTITLKNDGNATLNISASSITPADFTKTQTCGATLTAGSTCVFTLTFTPGSKGPINGTFTLTDDAPGSPQAVSLTGLGLSTLADTTFNPTSVSFGLVALNQVSNTQVVTLTNYGVAAITGLSTSITGTDSTLFQKIGTTCGTAVPSAGSCTVTLAFAPTTAAGLGNKSANLTFTDSAPLSPQNVALSGTAVATPPLAWKSYVDSEGGNTAVPNISAGTINVANGDGVIACVAASGTQTITGVTDGAGNVLTRVKRATGSPGTLEMWFKANAVANPAANFTVTYGAAVTFPMIAVSNYSGLATATVDQTSCNEATCAVASNGAGRTAVNVTTTAATELLAACTWDNSGAPYVAAGSYNPRSSTFHSGGTLDYQLLDKIVSSIGTHPNGNFATAGTSNYSSVFATFGGGAGSANLVAAPPSLSFGSVGVGATSPALTTTVTNTGSIDATISSNNITGTNAADFSKNNPCGPTIAAGASCDIAVTAHPSVAGAETAAITIVSNAAQLTIPLSVTGAIAAPTIAPTTLTFGSTQVGTPSAPQNITLTNNSTATITFTSITPSGDYLITSNSCGTTLGGSANCVLGITFNPSSTGTRTGSINIADNAAGSPQTIPLTGTGIAAGVLFSPSPVTFGNQLVGQPSPSQTVTLTNTGTALLTINTKSITGEFTQTNNCAATLGVGATCTFNVVFTPLALGVRTGTLSITDSAAGSPHSVLLSGTGTGGTPTMQMGGNAVIGGAVRF